MLKKEFPLISIVKDEYDYIIHFSNPRVQANIFKEYIQRHRAEYEANINKEFYTASNFMVIIHKLDDLIPTGRDALRLKGGNLASFELYRKMSEREQIQDYGHLLKFVEFDDYNFEETPNIDEIILTTNSLFE